MAWPFRKPVFVDNNDVIFLTEDGALAYPLTIDDENLYQQGIEKITNILKEWMVQDAAYTANLNQPIESSLSHQFKQIDLKFLPYQTQMETLLTCLKDTEINNSGSRFFDAIIRIHTNVSLQIINTFKGRFLAGMIYGLPDEINNIPLPKDRWKELIISHNWIPFLSIIQDLADNDDVVDKVKHLVQATKDVNVNIVRRTNSPL